jgi:1,4-dihydroxy-2-naphthoate octaprenyltransferase
VFEDRRQLIVFIVTNVVLILVAVIARWWFLGLVVLVMASGLMYRFGWRWRYRRSGVIP